MSRLTYAIPAAAATVLLAAVACSSPSVPASPTSSARPPSAAPTALTTAPPPPSPSPEEHSAVSDVCGGPVVPQARLVSIAAGRGAVVSAFDVGRGRTVALLLHQTNGDGFCGWWFYGSWLATQGVRVVGMDMCGYGRSTCPQPLQDTPVQQVAAVLRWVRAGGADRVVLVGASLGGSVAVDAAAALDVDAVVDLSGPFDYPTTTTSASLARLKVPTLIVISHAEDPRDFELLEAAFPRIPARSKRFVAAESGHGYSMLAEVVGGVRQRTPLGDTVAEWVTRG